MPATLTDDIERISGAQHDWATVTVAWAGADVVYVGSGKRVGIEQPVVVAGVWSLTVPLASEVLPAGVVLAVTSHVAGLTVVEHVALPPTAGTWTVAALLTDPPGAVASSALAAAVATLVPLTSPNLLRPADIGYDVILLAGQSNMRGSEVAFDAVRYDVVNPRVWTWPAYGQEVGLLKVATEPLSHPGAGTVGVGPGFSFAHWYAGAVPSNRRVLLVPAAVASTALAAVGAPWNVTTAAPASLYLDAKAAAKAALAAAGANARVTAILWCQGEADAGAGYQAALDALVAGFRADFPAAAFVVLQMAPDFIAANPSTAGVVNAVHIDTPRRLLNSGFADGSTVFGPSVDGTHYTGRNQRENGRRLVAAYFRAVSNVLGVGPVAPATVTLTQSGTSILVAWAQSTGRVTDYLVEWRLAGGTWATLARTVPDLNAAATITGTTNGSTYEVRVSTLNERGASAPTVASIATVTVPLQVTGVAAGTTTPTTVPLTWATTAGAVSWLVEYKRTADAVWLTSATVTVAAATVSLLDSSTAYDFRVSATNAAGTGPVSATLSATTALRTPILDVMAVSAARAYGTRRLWAAHAGSCLRVRRSSDSTEQDIGFTASGDLDTAALLTFCGAGDGFVAKLYDQSGNLRDLTQATAANQAKLVTAGVVNVLGGRPVMAFDGANDIYTDTFPGMWAAGAASVLSVLRINAPLVATARVVAESRSATTNGNYSPIAENGTLGTLRNFVADDALVAWFAAQSAGPALNDRLHAVGVVDTGTLWSGFVDGAAAPAAVTYSRTGRTITLDRFSVGGNRRTADESWAAMSLGELIVFYSALTTVQRQTGEADQKPYYGTP